MRSIFGTIGWLLLLSWPTAFAAAQDYGALVDGLLEEWAEADLVCLGEDHGRLHDSELRIALIRHPEFHRTVDQVMIEFANPVHQDLLDRFVLEDVQLSRAELRIVWRDAIGAETWESPIYEGFLRAIQEVNRGLSADDRIRVLAGDSRIDWENITNAEQLAPLMNRGGNIRETIARVLDAGGKTLAIYGAGHCTRIGMGFPGELEHRYPGRMRSVYSFFGEDGAREGRVVFDLGASSAYIRVRGTTSADLSATGMFLPPGMGPDATVGDMLDAIVYYGDVRDVVVASDPSEMDDAFRSEQLRRSQLALKAAELIRRRQ